LSGPPGTGKTTIAYLIAKNTKRNFIELSAINAGVSEVRKKIEEAKLDLLTFSKETVLFIDEIHRFSKSQQDVLLPAVENRVVTLIAATTENPAFSIISPLISRSILVELDALKPSDIETLIDRAINDERGLAGEFTIDSDAKDAIVRLSGKDARKALTILEVVAGELEFSESSAEQATEDAKKGLSGGKSSESSESKTKLNITLEDVENAIDKAFIKYDKQGDSHYDVASAFIKSLRGSDVDAALHYLARMLVSGEDVRFIARRLMISAAEDVGMADPSALQIATSAANAVQLVGMPEARIILGQAAVYIATAPKSNASYNAINEAIKDVESKELDTIPAYLRDSHSTGARNAQKKVTQYKYAHDYEFSIARQQYLPENIKNMRYYQPKTIGYEETISKRLKSINKLLGKTPE
jgi:putative ATPase